MRSDLKQVLIADNIAQSALCWHMRSVCQYDEAFDCGQLVLQLEHYFNKGGVQYEVLPFGMVYNVLKLALKQPVVYK